MSWRDGGEMMPYEKAEPFLLRELSSTSSAFATSEQRFKHCDNRTNNNINCIYS